MGIAIDRLFSRLTRWPGLLGLWPRRLGSEEPGRRCFASVHHITVGVFVFWFLAKIKFYRSAATSAWPVFLLSLLVATFLWSFPVYQWQRRHFQHRHDQIRANIIINTIYIRIIAIMIIITMMTTENRRFWRTSPQPLHENQDQDWGPGKRWKWWANVQLQHHPVRHQGELLRWWQNDSSCGDFDCAAQKKQEEEDERVRKEIKEYEQVKKQNACAQNENVSEKR